MTDTLYDLIVTFNGLPILEYKNALLPKVGDVFTCLRRDKPVKFKIINKAINNKERTCTCQAVEIN